MKMQIFIALVAFFALTSGVFVPPRPGHRKQHLLGAKECTWGPSYWCQNLTSAAGCHATKHCIQTVWIHKQLPPDSSSICQTCLDMVKQARDQLESNETQELIKEVFEGSCALLHIKEIVKECDKIADNYIPDLIDTLASQMNPQVVCSVAGLCNNEKFTKLIENSDISVKKPLKSDNCKGCYTVVGLMEDKFAKMTRDQVLQGFLQICGKAGSLSDACSNIVITYFNEIYSHLKDNFNQEQVCLMAGECSAQFHTHANVEITPISHIGYVPVGAKDDLPCELCEQLVHHLRDLLIANTTELEFKQVLQGLCKQTNSFKDECLALVDQYYAMAYQFLLTELDSNVVCKMAQICPGNNTVNVEQIPLIPLLPVESAQKALEITQKPIHRINMAMDSSSVKVMQNVEQAQLPIDLIVPPHTQMYNTQVCVFCEYLLHYLQQVITDPKSEDKIKHVIDGICDRLPSSVNTTCVEFVNMYEPALVAILAQEIDPSEVCPLLKCCPANSQEVEVFMHAESDGSKCPLCLFAVSKLEEMVKNEKTEANIKDALSKLCSRLSESLAVECNDFVNTYTNELVDMLIADLSPQEVCVYLKVCSSNKKSTKHEMIGGDTNTNGIADDTVNGQVIEPVSSKQIKGDPQCVLCEFVMKEVQDQLKDNSTTEEIEKIVHGICNRLPKSIGAECNGFVNQYANAIIQLLIEATTPSEICRMMHMCASSIESVKVEIYDCAICEAIVYFMEKILANPSIDHNVNHILEKTCRALPKRDQAKCKEIVDKYGRTIFDLIIHLSNKGLVCKEVGMCVSEAARPRRQTLIGGNKCTQGPAYWCSSVQNAEKCGSGAKQHCQEKVWGANKKNNK